MKRLLFFLNSYPLKYRLRLLVLLFVERLVSPQRKKKLFSDFLIESRSILGYIYDRNGNVKRQDRGIDVFFTEGGAPMSLFLRWNSSDFLAFEQVIVKKEYALACEYLESNGIAPRVVIDVGANVGCSSVYFHSVFPKARIVSIEPDETNGASLRINLAKNHITDARIFPVALWNEEARLSFQTFGDGRDWSRKVGEGDDGKVQAMTLSQICSDAEVHDIDILKVDIEGAESVIFRKDPLLANVLSRVKVLAIEIHDSEDIPVVTEILERLTFKTTVKNETLFAFRQLK